MASLSLTAADLECHFKWKLETGIDKKVSEVIKNVEEKLEIEPLRRVPYLCLLSYLYAIKRNQPYSKAYECLDEAERTNSSIAEGRLNSDFMSCAFLVEANRLNIDTIRSEKSADHQDRVVSLHNLWNDHETKNEVRASVLLVQALSCLRFGPLKYQLGAKAAGESASLILHRSFHDPYIEAYLLARIRRLDDICSSPGVHELELWMAAKDMAEQNCSENLRDDSRVQLAIILAHHAEAIARDESKSDQCESMADRARQLISEVADSSLVQKNFRIDLKCAKVYRLLNKADKLREMIDALTPLMGRTKKAQLLFELALAVKSQDPNEFEKLLLQGQNVADAPGHIWIDLSLLKHQASRICQRKLTPQQVILRYDDLLKQYHDNRMNRAVIMYNKAVYYTIVRQNENAIKWMVQAVNLDAEVRRKFPHRERKRMLNNMQRWRFPDEWLGWYADNMTDNPDDLTVQRLYETALEFDPSNQFALQHFAANRIRACEFQRAENLLRRLNEQCEAKQKLLCQALISQIATTQQLSEISARKLTECLLLGCKDACRVTASLLALGDSSASFSTLSYELCAHVELAFESHSAFFLDNELDTPEFPQETLDKLRHFLGTKTAEGDALKRGNAMRESRLKSAKLFIGDRKFSTVELNDAIVTALKDAKESIDRHFQEFLTRSNRSQCGVDYFPFGFTFAKNSKNQPGSGARKGAGATKDCDPADERQQTLAALIKILDENRADLKAKFFKKLPKECEVAFKDTGESLRQLLASRESQIFINEGPWLVLWQSMVNMDKHKRKITIEDLNTQLDQFKCRTGDGRPMTAYEMMHRAAEFTEETAVILLLAASNATSQAAKAQ